MMQTTHRTLAPGVDLTAVQTSKFKTCFFRVAFLAPLSPDTVSGYALLPSLLRRGTQAHPDMETLSAALDELYGGAIEPLVRKSGETLCVGFRASFLDDALRPAGEPILPQALALLGEVLLHPAGDDGFREDYFAGERDNLIQQIRGEINDKRQYATRRLIQLMCREEPYGVGKRGTEDTAAALTREGLWGQYQAMLQHLPIQLYYCGSAPAEEVEGLFRKALAPLLTAQRHSAPPLPTLLPPPHEAHTFTDRMEVTQGKLSLGFRLAEPCLGAANAARGMLLNALYGGSTNSKLFLNVREKLSLCYYASSSLDRSKGVMVVASGVEFAKFQEAREEILAQLAAIRRGDVTEEEFAGAKRFIVRSLRSNLDAQALLESFWLNQAITGEGLDPWQLVQAVEDTTLDEVVALAGQVGLDSIYYLTGKEA